MIKKTVEAKNLLSHYQISYDEIQIDKMPQKMRGLIRGALAMDTGYKSYPNIYFGKEHIGGLDDLKSHL
mgnify:FL=1